MTTVEVAQNLLLGPGRADTGLNAEAYGNVDDPVGAAYPASAMIGSDATLEWGSMFILADGETAPTGAIFLASALTLGDGGAYDFGAVEASCLVEGGPRSANVSVSTATLGGTPILPPGYDVSVPNQAPVPIGAAGVISFNEQVHTTVGRWDVLTVTAIHLVGEGLDIRLGVVSCAVPAGSVLASTGTSMDVAPALVGAAAVMLGGVLLVLRRRRAVR